MKMMMRTATATTTKRPDLDRLISTAIKDANSQNVSGVERCLDILRYLKISNLSSKELRLSKAILQLESLRNHGNPKIRVGVQLLFDSWMKTMYSSGREASNCVLKKKEDKCKYAPTRIRLHLTPKHLAVSKSKKKEDERSLVHETCKIKQNLNKSENPSFGTHGTLVSANPRSCPAMKKNQTEMLELFEIAKKSADVANAKGLLVAKAETSICIDTLALLIDFPISSTATDTRRIMEKLQHLTKHKDRKICGSASALLQHWRQSIIRDQQQGVARKA